LWYSPVIAAREASIIRRLGPILAATVVCPDPAAAAAAYHAAFGFAVRACGRVPESLAALWNAPAAAGRAWLIVGPQGDAAAGLIRLVEGPRRPPPPLTACGWAAAELTVAADLDRLAERLPGHGFAVLGPPRPLGSNPAIRAMQVAGPAGEVLYLTDIRAYGGPLDLARPAHPVDRVFIAVVAAPDMAAARGFYESRLGAARVSDRRVVVPVLNACQGRPAAAETPIGSVALAGGCLIECDGYPIGSPAQACGGEDLPGGLALVTIAVDAFDPPLAAAAVAAPADPPYSGGRAALLTGAAGEAIELVEVPR